MPASNGLSVGEMKKQLLGLPPLIGVSVTRLFMIFKLKGFQHIVSTFPNPVPAGQSKEKYLDENYEKLPGASAYTWYQAIMIVEASNEKPIVTFKQAIARSGKASDQ